MVLPVEEKLVHSIRFSSVGPGRVTGTDVVHHPKPMDLAMKLHYLRGIYYFSSQATRGLTTKVIKESMFLWLNEYYVTCGRFRRSPDTGRPFMKCNDCGVRFIEAKCDKTIHEWLEMLKENCELRKLLVSDQVIGPDLPFSPPLLIQITIFKCGGFALSLNWAHILGDALSVVDFINRWAQIISGLPADGLKQLHVSDRSSTAQKTPTKANQEPVSLIPVEPVGDMWTYSPKCKMGTFALHLTLPHLKHLRSKFFGHVKPEKVPLFESICAIFWRWIADVKEGEPQVVTVCKGDPSKRAIRSISNSQKISAVRADFSVKGSDPHELLCLLVDRATWENAQIEEVVERDYGVSDFIIYGGNLTFVDIGEADLYGIELKEHKPLFADYTIEGLGDEGVIVILPAPNDPKSSGDHDTGGMIVTMTLPESLLSKLKVVLMNNGMLQYDSIFS
ncbi:hypothetical protein SAY86_015766 [Trapa natans]|uniref:Protein ECERIFERUM 26-like n=1 Tax=Trapa natans TaxID=22666 RepID=A0AAN7LCK2_TRANT|nr:hypothetical protein SAY86_015766 [Trapa natans]